MTLQDDHETVLDDAARETFAAIADVLVPAAPPFPSASMAGVAGPTLDRALLARPDRVVELRQVLQTVSDVDPRDAVADIAERSPATLVLLIEAVTGAYILNPVVQDALGYHGQQPKAIDIDDPDYLDLLPAVLARGPVFRPAPATR